MIIETPNTETVERETIALANQTNQIQVVSHDDYLVAGDMLKQIKSKQKLVKELFAEAKELANKAHKSIVASEKKLLDPLLKAESVCAGKVQFFLQEQRRKELAEQERIRKEAEEKARAEAEARRKKEEEDRLKASEMLKAQGFDEASDEILEAPMPTFEVAPVIVAPVKTFEKVSGVHTRTTYKAEVTNLLLLVQEVASGRQPINLLSANEQVLNKMASALKHELKIPGVEVREHSTVVAKAQ